MLTTAVGNMQAAYTNAAGGSNPDFVNLGVGNIAGKTLAPGFYKWSSDRVIAADISIKGNSNNVFIFQITGNSDMSSAVEITLSGGVQAKNIFWVMAGIDNLETISHFEGNKFGQIDINMKHSSDNGFSLLELKRKIKNNYKQMKHSRLNNYDTQEDDYGECTAEGIPLGHLTIKKQIINR